MPLPTIAPYSLPQPGTWPQARAPWTAQTSSLAFLIHDLQSYFLRPYQKDQAPLSQVLHNVISLKKACNRLGIPVIFSAQPGEQSRDERGLLWDMWGPGIISAPGFEGFLEELSPGPQDIILHKRRYSAFHATELEQLLRERECSQLMISGVYGHIGCLATAIDAFMLGIQPFMIADAIADFSLEDHQTTLRQVARTCGVVTQSQEILSLLDAKDATLPASGKRNQATKFEMSESRKSAAAE